MGLQKGWVLADQCGADGRRKVDLSIEREARTSVLGSHVYSMDS